MLQMAEGDTKRPTAHSHLGWMRLMVPYQIAYNPISAIVALYILKLHGSVIDVAYAITFAYLVVIPASVFWGELVERYHRRRLFINLSFVGLALSLLGLYFSTTVLEVILVYGLLSFAIMANATPLNLLVMETEPKSKWASGFSRLQMFSSIGCVVSLIFAAMLTYFVSLRLLILALVPFTIVAGLLTVSIAESKRLKARHNLLSTFHAFRSRFLSHHIYFHPGGGSLGKRLSVAGRELVKRGYFQTLLVAIFVLYLATGLFNASYTAGLKGGGLSNFEIFTIFAIAYAAATAAFLSLEVFMAKITRMRTLIDALLTRGFGYILIALVFLIFAGGVAFIGANTLIYMFTSGIAYALFYTTTNTLVFSAVGNSNKSHKLGIYSGVMGLGTLIGSLLSGYTSFFVGYWFTFAVAGGLTVFTVYLFLRASKIKTRGMK